MPVNYIAVDGSSSRNGTGFSFVTKNLSISAKVHPYEVLDIDMQNNTVIYNRSKSANPTNNRGELLGIFYAYNYIENSGIKSEWKIISDSNYSINCITTWYPNWLTYNQLEGKLNLDLISKIYEKACKLHGEGYVIKLIHQKAHLTNKALNSLTGEKLLMAAMNKKADILANEGYKYDQPTIIN